MNGRGIFDALLFGGPSAGENPGQPKWPFEQAGLRKGMLEASLHRHLRWGLPYLLRVV